MPYATINGVKLNYEVHGDSGEPLVLVHGYTGDITDWRHQLPAFAQSHRVIAPDLRGFGRSATAFPPVTTIDDVRPLTMEGHADDLADMLNELGVREPIFFCALSMGGYVGWQFLQKYPERVRALIQCDHVDVFVQELARTGVGRAMRLPRLEERVHPTEQAGRVHLVERGARAEHPEARIVGQGFEWDQRHGTSTNVASPIARPRGI